MKHMKNVKWVVAPGFLMDSDSLSGEQILGFFGLREKVIYSISDLNSSIENFHSRKW